MIKSCKFCGNNFEKKYEESKKYFLNKKYCSQKCYGDSKIGVAPPEKVIEILRQSRYLPENIEKRNKGLQRGDKHHHWGGGDVVRDCLECGTSFKSHRSRDKAKFCSRLCKTNNSNHGLSTENEKLRKSLIYKVWRKSVFERDQYTCQECGLKSGFGHTVVLHADHIKPFAFNHELRFDVTNGRTLCQTCHRKTDTYGTSLMWKIRKQKVCA